jgi:hypothetical protein
VMPSMSSSGGREAMQVHECRFAYAVECAADVPGGDQAGCVLGRPLGGRLYLCHAWPEIRVGSDLTCHRFPSCLSRWVRMLVHSFLKTSRGR